MPTTTAEKTMQIDIKPYIHVHGEGEHYGGVGLLQVSTDGSTGGPP